MVAFERLIALDVKTLSYHLSNLGWVHTCVYPFRNPINCVKKHGSRSKKHGSRSARQRARRSPRPLVSPTSGSRAPSADVNTAFLNTAVLGKLAFPTADEPRGHVVLLPSSRLVRHGGAWRSGAPCGTCIRSHTRAAHQQEPFFYSGARSGFLQQRRALGFTRVVPLGLLGRNFDVRGALALV